MTGARQSIAIRGAREHNLKGVDVEIPRDRLVVITGVSGSGKSSLAFDTLYAEGQRRLMASMSAYAKRFVSQLKQPEVDFVHGLSPVISIEQKALARNPRSTVGTLTDIFDYLRMLAATVGTPHCPDCGEAVPAYKPYRVMEHILSLPAGAEVELRAPAWLPYGEDLTSLFDQIRALGYRRVLLDGVPTDLGDEGAGAGVEGTPRVEVVLDRFVVAPNLDRQVLAALGHGRRVGDGLFSLHVPGGDDPLAGFGCSAHHRVMVGMHHGDFTFNDPAGACTTCTGIGRAKQVHPPLLVPDPRRTLRDGAIVKEALGSDKNTAGGRILESLSRHFGFGLDVPWAELDDGAKRILLYGTGGRAIQIVVPEGARTGHQHAGKELTFRGLVPQIEHHYRWYRRHGDASTQMEDYLDKVMVEVDCPDCHGSRLKPVRRLVRIGGRTLPELGRMHLDELLAFLRALEPEPHQRAVADIILREITGRLEVLVGIGLDYLNIARRSDTLSGGEAQRIRLSTQIGSGLMGMLYVLDEPSIGLHPKDNARMIDTLRKLVDLGNTVVVVEHDEDTIRAADHVVEMGPGPGIHGGEVVCSGTPAEVLAHPTSLTGLYLSGRRSIPVPAARRPIADRWLRVFGARHHNLAHLDVGIPLGVLTCITGASGSGKSSLLHDTIHKRLVALKEDSRVLSGAHDRLEGHEHIDAVVDIDQSPIGRSPRSNPATYVGFYDTIRKLFAGTDAATSRGWSAARFSFNVKGGRCEECAGEGTITTKLAFMPDVEVGCPTCRGARYNDETLEITWRGRNIAEVLAMSVEEGVAFFAEERAIHRKIAVLSELGLGYLELGHPATILSGGEAQRIKLAAELGSLRRGKHLLYILDEPTTGLHVADIDRLLHSLTRLVDLGHSVVVIEHNLDVIKVADWVIDLGPEGGHRGGRLVATGRPEDVAACEASHTGRHLRRVLPSLGRRDPVWTG